MIQQEFKLQAYDWKVIALFDVRDDDLDKILELLNSYNCNRDCLKEVCENFEDGIQDNGFAFTNFRTKTSIIVVGYGSNNEEAMNTLAHEARHIEQHLSKRFEISDEEERCYLLGKLIQQMYTVFRLTL